MRLVFGASTNVGKVRSHNEDRYAVEAPLGLAVLADGMGGHEHGDVAAAMAVDTMVEVISQPWRARWWRRLLGKNDPLLQLVSAVERANQRVWRADDRSDVFSMGTTLVGAWFQPPTLYLTNVGDSRAYRHRDMLEQLTQDHSLVADYLAAGLLQPDQVADFPYRNIINRGIGLRASVRVDAWRLELQPGDRYLLCSDGLTDLVDDATIGRHMAEAAEPAATAQRLVEVALDAGGIDNITAVVVHILPEEA
jgi:protein phosphatase